MAHKTAIIRSGVIARPFPLIPLAIVAGGKLSHKAKRRLAEGRRASARLCPGHPRLRFARVKTWMPATSAGMTEPVALDPRFPPSRSALSPSRSRGGFASAEQGRRTQTRRSSRSERRLGRGGERREWHVPSLCSHPQSRARVSHAALARPGMTAVGNSAMSRPCLLGMQGPSP